MAGDAKRAANELVSRFAVRPAVALVLGSGLGALAKSVTDAVVVPTHNVAGYPASTVAGHQGRLVFGRLEDVSILIVQGRLHLYEGYSVGQITYPIRLMHALGVRRVLLTNAAGGIHPTLSPGTLMFITDHINASGATLTGSAALSGTAAPEAVRTRDDTVPYDIQWLDRTERAALRLGIATRRGTYVWTRGPCYETKAEIGAFRRLGGDAVGMSTVPEALQASALGMDVLGISTITNAAAGLSDATLSHEDVLAVGERVRGDLERLVRATLKGY
ncbi:MAG: purine-nucleoside phosphorylase [Rhodothermales bacterium]